MAAEESRLSAPRAGDAIALLTCAATVLVGASSAHAQDTTLRYRWVKGDQVSYRTSQQKNVRMTSSVLPEKGEIVEP